MSDEIRRCGRPKVNGEPCRSIVHYHNVACPLHQSESETALVQKISEAWRKGYETGKRDERSRINREEEYKKQDLQREKEYQERARTHDAKGRQIVRVLGKYSYVWSGDPVKVGDEVLVPSNWLVKTPQWQVVTHLGSDYTGEMSSILKARSVSRDADTHEQAQPAEA